MKIEATYSHLNGLEYLMVHKPAIWNEIKDVISAIDASSCKTKVSKEKNIKGTLLYSPIAMNAAMKVGFEGHGWKERRQSVWVTSDEKVARNVIALDASDQKKEIKAAGHTPIYSFNQTDFVKDRVAVEVQFGKYSFVAHDLFVKHMSFFVSDIIDVGIEILPMKALEAEMSSGVPYYERDLFNVVRQGRGVPAVPLILVGITP